MVQALGCIGMDAANLDAWSDFATRQLGLQPVDGGGSCRAFRMDDRRQRIIADNETGAERYFGWEVADSAALDALSANLDVAGVAVQHGSSALADQRFVRALVSFHDPDGNRLEAFTGRCWRTSHSIQLSYRRPHVADRPRTASGTGQSHRPQHIAPPPYDR